MELPPGVDCILGLAFFKQNPGAVIENGRQRIVVEIKDEEIGRQLRSCLAVVDIAPDEKVKV